MVLDVVPQLEGITRLQRALYRPDSSCACSLYLDFSQAHLTAPLLADPCWLASVPQILIDGVTLWTLVRSCSVTWPKSCAYRHPSFCVCDLKDFLFPFFRFWPCFSVSLRRLCDLFKTVAVCCRVPQVEEVALDSPRVGFVKVALVPQCFVPLHDL